MTRTLAFAALATAGLALSACDETVSTASGGTPSLLEQNCLAAVSRETSNGDVALLGSEFSEANTLVRVGVGADRAPWNCLVANDGTVAEVSFAGSEGAL